MPGKGQMANVVTDEFSTANDMIKRVRRTLRRWAYTHDTPIRRARHKRMLEMVRVLELPADARIVDLGGTE